MTETSELRMPCPECGRAMVVRTNRENGSAFMGCTGYPDDCRHTQAIPEWLRLKQAGAAMLPGLES
jgi:ssDNA-binding Zn-finger/Zn-ribbon topoisomerase 1